MANITEHIVRLVIREYLGDAPVTKCPDCDSKNITMGVFDRIEIIKDKKDTKSPSFRPPYVYQIPLTFIPRTW